MPSITRTDAAALIEEDASKDILKTVAETNPILQLARRLPNMPTSRTRMPVLNSFATAYFVDGDTGLKQTTKVDWANKYIDAEEIAVIVPIAEALLDDASFDIWGQVKPELVIAINKAINEAVLFGTGIPGSWTTNMGAAGLLARIVAASHNVDLSTQIAAGDDMYDILLGDGGVISLIENDGFMATGHIAALPMRAKLRDVREKVWNGTTAVPQGAPLFQRSMQDRTRYDLDSAPIYFPTDGSMDPLVTLLFAGQWDQLVWSMRQDMSWTVSREASIHDASGNLLYNFFQQDMVGLRVVMRLGFALPNPINRVNPTAATRLAFAALVP